MKLNLQQTSFVRVGDVQIPDSFYNRMKTGDEKYDEMFGDGILPGMTMTICGKPGSGKTTVLLQLGEALIDSGYQIGYCSGEEAIEQLAFTSKRLNIKNVQIACMSDVDTIRNHMKHFDLIVIDSYQALRTDKDMNSKELENYIISELIGNAAKDNCTLIFVMHLTVMGTLKGGTGIPHAVDCNIMIRTEKDAPTEERIIDFSKNRFGRTGQHYATMTATGLVVSDERPAQEGQRNKRNPIHANIMAMDNPPQITKQRVAEELGITEQQAYCALYQMEKQGLIVKFGTGKSIIYKHAEVKSPAEVEEEVGV